MAEEGYKVLLNVYDLSQGLARQLSQSFLGKVIEGIWHTGVVVYGSEYFFGGGIQHLPAGTTPYGNPIKVVDLGVTYVPKEDFELYLQQISPRYTAETYSLLTHNCNNFSNEVAQFLVGSDIPEYILQLPNDVMNSQFGAVIMPMIQNLETTLKVGAVPQVPQFRPPTMSQPVQSSSSVANSQASGKKAVETLKEPNIPETVVPPAVKPAEVLERSPNGTVPEDPLGDARNKVQEEITREFAAIMASGTLHASEAAALATRKVMQKYGHLDVSQQS